MIAEVLDRFAAGGAVLAYATSGLSPQHEQARPGPGAWSIAELVAHLVDSDAVAVDRMKRIIAEENPILQAYDENLWITRLGAQEMPVEEGVNLFAANRHWIGHILRRCAPEDFARTGQHTERGRVTLAEQVVLYCNHLDHHLKFLYAKRAALGMSVYPRYTREPGTDATP
jgi:hypothetical protein